MTTPICANLDQFTDGELPRAAADAFRAHLPDCAPCQAGLGDRLHLDALAARAVKRAEGSAPPPPPVEGPGLRHLNNLRRVLDAMYHHDNERRDPMWLAGLVHQARQEVDAALAAEQAREKLQREASRLFQRDDIQDNRLTYSPDDSPAHMHLEIDEDTVAAIRAMFAAEPGSAP